jgi:hypothetical protein
MPERAESFRSASGITRLGRRLPNPFGAIGSPMPDRLRRRKPACSLTFVPVDRPKRSRAHVSCPWRLRCRATERLMVRIALDCISARGAVGTIVRTRCGSDVRAIAVMAAKSVSDPSPANRAKINGGSVSPGRFDGIAAALSAPVGAKTGTVGTSLAPVEIWMCGRWLSLGACAIRWRAARSSRKT